MIQIALFKCSTRITNIWLTPQVKFKSCTTNWTPCQDFCLEVAAGPRVVRLCPQHTPGSCWDDAVGGRRAEAFGAYKILIENSVVWASNSVDLTSGILLNFFSFGEKACNDFWFFPLWIKFQCQNAEVCRALKGPGGTQKFKYLWMQQAAELCPSVPLPVPLALIPAGAVSMQRCSVVGCPLLLRQGKIALPRVLPWSCQSGLHLPLTPL